MHEQRHCKQTVADAKERQELARWIRAGLATGRSEPRRRHKLWSHKKEAREAAEKRATEGKDTSQTEADHTG